MSKHYNNDIQEQINSLFETPSDDGVSVDVIEVVEPIDEPISERKLLSLTKSTREEINDLFETDTLEEISESKEVAEAFVGGKDTSTLNEQINDLFETTSVSFENIISEVEVAEPIKKTPEGDYISDLAGAMSRVAKRTSEGSGQEKLTEEQVTLNNFQIQLDGIRRSLRESTIVSGIGQGGDGQTPGSGVVWIRDLDDVSLDNISDGDSLIWDNTLGSFVPGAGGSGGSGVGRLVAGDGIVIDPPGGIGVVEVSTNLNLGDLNDVVGTPATGDLLIYNGSNWAIGTLNTSELQLNNPQGNPFNLARYSRYEIVADGIYTTQEDANILFADLIDDLDARVEQLEPDPTDPDASSIGDLDDVNIANAESGDFLVYDEGEGKWNATTVDIPNVTVGNVLPGTGAEQQGDIWYNTDTGELYIYNNVWTVVSTSGGASVELSDTPPAGDPQTGNLWVDTNTWSLYVYDGFNWVGLTNEGLTGSTDEGVSVFKQELLAAVNVSTDYESLKSALISALS